MKTRWLCTLTLLVLATGAVTAAHAQDTPAPAPADTKLELSLGTVKDKLEGAAVRALVKYGDRLTADDLITRAKEPVFYAITRKVDFDVTDKGTFAGVALRYGVKAIKAPLIPLEGEPDTLVTDSRG